MRLMRWCFALLVAIGCTGSKAEGEVSDATIDVAIDTATPLDVADTSDITDTAETLVSETKVDAAPLCAEAGLISPCAAANKDYATHLKLTKEDTFGQGLSRTSPKLLRFRMPRDGRLASVMFRVQANAIAMGPGLNIGGVTLRVRAWACGSPDLVTINARTFDFSMLEHTFEFVDAAALPTMIAGTDVELELTTDSETHAFIFERTSAPAPNALAIQWASRVPGTMTWDFEPEMIPVIQVATYACGG
jgi:hypothetical protein